MARQITVARVGEIMKAVLLELKKIGGPVKVKDIFPRIEPNLNLTEYEKGTYEKSGYVRWISIVHFFSIDCVKAGFLQKKSGRWILTQDGEAALELSAEEFISTAIKKYRAWKKDRPEPIEEEIGDSESKTDEIIRQISYEQASEQAQTEIEEHINKLGPYDFQNLIAELLRGMGYHVPRVAEPGPDGGIDIIAYKDPLGTESPRIKVQIKHRNEKLTVKEVRELEGLLRKEGDIGLLVSSSGFTKEVQKEIQASNKHIETMDMEKVIELWQKYYEKISNFGKQLLPLVGIYFLAPKEE